MNGFILAAFSAAKLPLAAGSGLVELVAARSFPKRPRRSDVGRPSSSTLTERRA